MCIVCVAPFPVGPGSESCGKRATNCEVGPPFPVSESCCKVQQRVLCVCLCFLFVCVVVKKLKANGRKLVAHVLWLGRVFAV